jgi:hypothetical protein
MLWVIGLYAAACVALISAEWFDEERFERQPDLTLKVGLLLCALTVFVAVYIGGGL